ncbi:MAG: hypothetical protein R2733_11300 [Acidimicrobiales bacterium]
MPTSNASSGTSSKLPIVVAGVALTVAVAAVVGLFALRSSSSDGGSLQSFAEPAPEPPPSTVSNAVGEPSGERSEDSEDDAGSEDSPSTTTSTTERVDASGDPILSAYGELWSVGEQFLGGDDPVGMVATLSDQVGDFPVADDATVASMSLEVDREERDRAVRIQYRTSVRYYSGQSVDEIVELYRTTTPALDLPERESEQGTDADGDFITIDFGSFSDHPDPQIWWANLSVEVRTDDTGTLVRIYYTITRTEAAVPTGLLAEAEAGLPLADGYENTSVRVSLFAGDPYVQPVRFSADLTATATLASATSDEAAELSRLADLAVATGNWQLDEQTDSGVWLDHAVDDDIRNYLTLYLTDSESVARYAYS